MENVSDAPLYDFGLDKVIEEAKTRKCKRALLQFPNGLVNYASGIAGRINSETGCETIVSLDPCYGACDLAIYAASRLNVDLIIHFGHARWPVRHDIPTIYVETFTSLDISSMLPRVKELLPPSKRIGVVSTVQHVRESDKVRKYLESNGFKVLIGRARGNVAYDGQVLGCDYSTAKSISHAVDMFILIGGGKFHAIGLSLATRKKTIVVDPFSKEISSTDGLLHRYLKTRYACIMGARSAKNFGVVIGLKFGQLDLRRAFGVRDKLEESGKRVVLFCADNLTPEQLNSISGIDAFVITACPRIAIDDSELYRKPVLTADEAEMMFSDELLEAYLSSR